MCLTENKVCHIGDIFIIYYNFSNLCDISNLKMFYYRSSTTYNFLREQDILHLPCPRTIRRYLSLINIQYGFDKQFFQLLKKRVGILQTNKNTEC